LAGLAGNKFLTKTCFNSFSRWKLLHFFIKKYTSLHCDVFNWATPWQSSTSCLQLFGIFIM